MPAEDGSVITETTVGDTDVEIIKTANGFEAAEKTVEDRKSLRYRFFQATGKPISRSLFYLLEDAPDKLLNSNASGLSRLVRGLIAAVVLLPAVLVVSLIGSVWLVFAWLLLPSGQFEEMEF